jgi:hypothetical protein
LIFIPLERSTRHRLTSVKEFFGALPIVCIISNFVYRIFEYAGLFLAHLFILFGFWTPEAHLRKAREERMLWLRKQVKEVQRTLGVPSLKT